MKTENGRIRIGCLFEILFLCLIIAAGLYFYFDFKMEDCEVIGGEFYTEDELEEKIFRSGIDRYPYLLYLKTEVLGIYEDIPFIEKYSIEIADRNSVRIYVYDKSVAGCVSHMNNFFSFDRNGVVTDSTGSRPENVPVVTGLSFTKTVIGEKLGIAADGIFEKILKLTQLFEKYEIDVSEINFDLRYNVTLYCNGSQALLGQGDNYDRQLSALHNVIAASDGTKYIYDLRNYSPENGEIPAKPIE